MSQQNSDSPTTLPTDNELVYSRVFNAPRALVWKAWSQAEHLAQWWGPEGWTLPVCEIDFKPGGKWFYAMQGPEGEMGYAGATYQEIVEPERIVYVDYFADEKGNQVADLPETHVTITFTENAGKTTMSYLLRFAKTEDRDTIMQMGMEYGFKDSLERLVKHLSTVA